MDTCNQLDILVITIFVFVIKNEKTTKNMLDKKVHTIDIMTAIRAVLTL